MIFVAYGGGDPFDIQWTKQSGGVCEVYSDGFGVCLKGSNIKEVFSLYLIFPLKLERGIKLNGDWNCRSGCANLEKRFLKIFIEIAKRFSSKTTSFTDFFVSQMF